MLRIITFLTFFKWRPEPNNYKLADFHWRVWSTHLDGVSIPQDGRCYRTLFYRRVAVYEAVHIYQDGRETERHYRGSRRLRHIARVADAYRFVCRACYHLAGLDLQKNFNRNVVIAADVYELLVRHPDFHDLINELRRHGWRFSLNLRRDGAYKVVGERVL
jgi:hypothetical protein